LKLGASEGLKLGASEGLKLAGGLKLGEGSSLGSAATGGFKLEDKVSLGGLGGKEIAGAVECEVSKSGSIGGSEDFKAGGLAIGGLGQSGGLKLSGGMSIGGTGIQLGETDRLTAKSDVPKTSSVVPSKVSTASSGVPPLTVAGSLKLGAPDLGSTASLMADNKQERGTDQSSTDLTVPKLGEVSLQSTSFTSLTTGSSFSSLGGTLTSSSATVATSSAGAQFKLGSATSSASAALAFPVVKSDSSALFGGGNSSTAPTAPFAFSTGKNDVPEPVNPLFKFGGSTSSGTTAPFTFSAGKSSTPSTAGSQQTSAPQFKLGGGLSSGTAAPFVFSAGTASTLGLGVGNSSSTAPSSSSVAPAPFTFSASKINTPSTQQTALPSPFAFGGKPSVFQAQGEGGSSTGGSGFGATSQVSDGAQALPSGLFGKVSSSAGVGAPMFQFSGGAAVATTAPGTSFLQNVSNPVLKFGESGSSGLSIGRPQGLSVGGTPGLNVGGTPGLNVGGTPGLSVGGTPGLSVGGTPGLNAGGMPGLSGAPGAPTLTFGAQTSKIFFSCYVVISQLKTKLLEA
jgi:hypothetical protein